MMRIKSFRTRRNWLRRSKKKGRKILLLLFTFIFGSIFLYSWLFLPGVKNASELSFSESTIIYDRDALKPDTDPDDHILYIIHGEENREYIPLSEISKPMINATIAIEDDKFYHHFGFDIGGITKAFLYEFFGIGSKRGGSTITQQLVKQVFLSSERTVSRKVKEILIAIKLELAYSKDEILELYLNKISYGNNTYGVEAASYKYFGKSARDLNIAEASILASIPLAPTRFSPYGSNRDLLMGTYEYRDYFKTEKDIKKSKENKSTDEQNDQIRVYKKGRKDLVLERMLNLEMITQSQFTQAWSDAQTLEFNPRSSKIEAPHFVFYAREQLEEKYGKEFLNKGGLRIYTSLDPDIQSLAEETIKIKTPHYPDTYGANNIALTAINPSNGEILAYVGGKNFFNEKTDGQVDVLTSFRQAGSSFKPFVYAAGFDSGYKIGDIIYDVETDFGEGYIPQNFDEKFRGPVSLRKSLNESLNIPAVKMAYLAKPKKILALAKNLDIQYQGNAETHGVALGIGVAEVQPLSHINAYQVFVNNGKYFPPISILEIHDSEGNVLEKVPSPQAKEVLNPEITALVRNILTDESTRPQTEGFNWNQLLQLKDIDNGAKTGTSNRVIENPEFDEEEEISDENLEFISVPGDSWTIGFTPNIVSGVWVGNNKGKPMKSGATGLAVAAPIWKAFTQKANGIMIEKEINPQTQYEEVELITKEINKLSGKLASPQTPEHLKISEVYAPSFLPDKIDDSVTRKNATIFNGRLLSHSPFGGLQQNVNWMNIPPIIDTQEKWTQAVNDWTEEHPEFFITLGKVLNDSKKDLIDPPSTLRNQTNAYQGQSLLYKNLRHKNDSPSIKITHPKNKISNSLVQAQVRVFSKNPILWVEYYLDNQPVYKSTKYPFSASFPLPSNINPRKSHLLTAIIMDSNFGVAKDSLGLNISLPDKKETSNPSQKGLLDIILISPNSKQLLPPNTKVTIWAKLENADKYKSLNIKFLVNGLEKANLKNAPYKTYFTPKNPGKYKITIQAFQNKALIKEKSIYLQVSQKTSNPKSSKPIISKSDTLFRSLFFEVFFPEHKNIELAEFIIGKGSQNVFYESWNPTESYKHIYVLKNKDLTKDLDATLYVKYRSKSQRQISDKINIQF